MISHVSVIALAVIVAVNTLFVAGLAVALFMIHRKINQALDQAAPALAKATETLQRVEEATSGLQQRVEHVLSRTTELVDHVAERVDTTTAIAEEAITEPLIGAASLVAGVNRGLRTYAERTAEKGEGG